MNHVWGRASAQIIQRRLRARRARRHWEATGTLTVACLGCGTLTTFHGAIDVPWCLLCRRLLPVPF